MAVDDLDSYHQYHEEEDDYIDMEVNSYSNFYCHSTPKPSPSPLDPRGEFEFQMSLNSMKTDLISTTSPADELFYKGKLLPLHLPPRLQMVEKLISSSSTSSPFHTNKYCKVSCEEIYSTPLNTNASTTPANGVTPFESCNVSPSESCRVSKELNIEEYLAKYASNEERAEFMSNIPTTAAAAAAAAAAAVEKKLSWTRKLRLMKQSTSILSKLKTSRSYLKIIFRKSGCLDESSSSAAAAGVAKSKDVMNGGNLLSSSGRVQDKEYLNKVDDKHPFRQIVQQIINLDRDDRKEAEAGKSDGKIRYRRSFSGAFIRRSTANKLSSSSSSSSSLGSSSSSSSNSVNNSNDQLIDVKRSSRGSNSEFESPIQGAIAYCKKSQQVLIRPQKTTSEVGHSLSSSRHAPTSDENKRKIDR